MKGCRMAMEFCGSRRAGQNLAKERRDRQGIEPQRPPNLTSWHSTNLRSHDTLQQQNAASDNEKEAPCIR